MTVLRRSLLLWILAGAVVSAAQLFRHLTPEKRKNELSELTRKTADAEGYWQSHKDDPIAQVTPVFDLHSLGLLREEAGDYPGAIEAYIRSSKLGRKSSKVSLAVVFEDEMGEARSLRKIEHRSEASKFCKSWNSYIRLHPIEIKLTQSLHWGSKKIAQSRWDYSCGDVQKGLATLRQIMATECDADIAWRASLALEQYYRSTGDSAKADEIGDWGDALQAANQEREFIGETSCPRNELRRKLP